MNSGPLARLLNRIGTLSPWFLAFLAAALLQVAALMLTYSARIEAMGALLPAGATMHDKLAAADMMQSWEPVRCAFLPFRLLAAWVAFSLVVFYSGKLFSSPQPLRFRQAVSLEFHAEIFPAIGAVLIALFPPNQSGRVFPLPSAPLNLLGVFGSSFGWMTTMLLGQLNLFQALYIAALTIGLCSLSGFGKIKSCLIIVSIWALALFGQMSLMQYVGQEMHIPMGGY